MKSVKSSVIMTGFGLFAIMLSVVQPEVWAETGPGTAENTKLPLQIINQTGIKVVAQINYSDTMPNAISKQVMAVKNL